MLRPCAMVIPDFELICEIMLVAEGFIDARLLARKFISLYTLCKELLSKQVRTYKQFVSKLNELFRLFLQGVFLMSGGKKRNLISLSMFLYASEVWSSFY